MRRAVPCEDCRRPCRRRRCWDCHVAHRRAAEKPRRAACRLCGKPIPNLHPTCHDCADAYWQGERARVRQIQQREASCYACGRWHERPTPGSVFCATCAWQLDSLTALIAAACGTDERAAGAAA